MPDAPARPAAVCRRQVVGQRVTQRLHAEVRRAFYSGSLDLDQQRARPVGT